MPSNGVLRDGLTPPNPPTQFPQPAPSAAHFELKLLDLSRRLLVQCCFTSTETIRCIRGWKPRTATSTFTQLLNSVITTTTKTLPLTNGRDWNVMQQALFGAGVSPYSVWRYCGIRWWSSHQGGTAERGGKTRRDTDAGSVPTVTLK